MCGIVGIFGKQSAPSLDLDILTHRGPDHTDWVTVNDMALGHTRLSIVDVDGGDQPIPSPDERYWLISNGEIYNHLDIRAQLPDYDFQTNTDSEVIVALYQHYGTAAVDHLDGMFAFAVYDEVANSIYMVRDPLGIKPLYYGWQDGVLYFASELKALQHHVETLHEFPPGHWYTPQDGFVKYYDLDTVVTDMETQPPPAISDIERGLR
ncbi:MAG: asparagine synthetase B, partial [Chloroflexota bacterium]